MREVFDFKHRVRLTPYVKALLQLPCMMPGAWDWPVPRAEPLFGAEWRRRYTLLLAADVHEQLPVAKLQGERLEVSREEDNMDVTPAEDDEDQGPGAARPAAACFANQEVYATPSAYIASLIAALPEGERLTRDQTLFMVRFAQACDAAWADEAKPPHERKVHHLLLLGQGGSGKTHVVQKLVFQAVHFIWPPESPEEPSLMVVAASNAQAKNISSATVEARTIHNASGMRVQKLINPLMRPGNKQKHLTRLWGRVRVLVIEEVSMVAAAMYNMLDVRSMHGRSQTHDVSETTYKKPHHHFGRVPIVIHLGDFLQLSPTGQIGLVEDVNTENEDG